MSTSIRTRNEPASGQKQKQQASSSAVQSGPSFRREGPMRYNARLCITAQCAPQTEHFPMSKINEAFARLDSGKARYRIVLDADFQSA